MICCAVPSENLQEKLESLEHDLIDINSPLAQLHTVVYETRKNNSALQRQLNQSKIDHNGILAERERHQAQKDGLAKLSVELDQEQQYLDKQVQQFQYEFETFQTEDFFENEDKVKLIECINLHKTLYQSKWDKFEDTRIEIETLKSQLNRTNYRYHCPYKAGALGTIQRLWRSFLRVVRFDFLE
ncbi:hypothetical protein SS50377_26526 [Spironucleus salmonicida]|uniref:Uncharacterized protein n=1 Tax=Spironucleus salmonicida TaxID=348837 RepID=V6LL22_9EUKA|nr:hypothetical protein SS50377_26526 [Spironucleus salmonicida]|eukprot:EST41379.1 hypothetical protein SS50377_19095 [Spironucleus salmonicida]